MSDIITVKNLGHSFLDEDKKTETLRDISLAVRAGEFFTILGPSGCGKSTLLRIIAGMIEPSKGTIEFSPPESVRYLSMVFQSFALFPWMTVEKNVEFGLRMKGVPEKERRHRREEHIREIGLGGFEKTYPKDLSGGMKQRVGVARAMAISPKILLMDEPFSALDAFTAEKLRQEVLDFWLKDRMTIIMVTHLVDEAVEMSDRILVMTPRPGRIEAVIPVDLSRPRNRRSREFFDLADRIMKMVKV